MMHDSRLHRSNALRIALADTEDAILRCHPVLVQLRPHIPKVGFVERVRRMQAHGFRLAYLEVDEVVRAVAGYRLLDQFVSGLVLYVDDLITDVAARSQGYGAALLGWLEAEACTAGCTHLELDSGVHRADAHRFYFREGLTIIGFHFKSTPTSPQSTNARSTMVDGTSTDLTASAPQ